MHKYIYSQVRQNHKSVCPESKAPRLKSYVTWKLENRLITAKTNMNAKNKQINVSKAIMNAKNNH